MATDKKGFQKFHDLKNALIVRGLELTSQLFSITFTLNCWIKTTKRNLINRINNT